MADPSRVGVGGPLARHAGGFIAELVAQGYSVHTAVGLLQLMAHLSHWLDEHGLDAGDLTPDRVHGFLRDRAAAGYARRLSPRGLAPLLRYLGGIGVLPEPVGSAARGAMDGLVGEFVVYLVPKRGLAAATVRGYREVAARFLSSHWPGVNADRSALAELSAGGLSAFVLAESTRHGAGSLNNIVTGLRALLRFLEVSGLTAPGLAEAVPRGPGWRRSSHARVLGPDEVARLLAGCDRRQAAGRRDYAIVLLLVRLGLRAGEVAALRLEDVDWRHVGAHRLRHTAASSMRRRGAPLSEIGQVLRHRHQATTAIYATVEADELRALARPWPGALA
jgi:integrase/recombinase XerD